jgi:hypothetical protein
VKFLEAMFWGILTVSSVSLFLVALYFAVKLAPVISLSIAGLTFVYTLGELVRSYYNAS